MHAQTPHAIKAKAVNTNPPSGTQAYMAERTRRGAHRVSVRAKRPRVVPQAGCPGGSPADGGEEAEGGTNGGRMAAGAGGDADCR